MTICPTCKGERRIGGHLCPTCGGTAEVLKKKGDEMTMSLKEHQLRVEIDLRQKCLQQSAKIDRLQTALEKIRWLEDVNPSAYKIALEALRDEQEANK